MNLSKTTNLRNTLPVMTAVLVICAAGGGAQQNLGELVTMGGFDWMIGEWAATTDQGGKIHSFYKWGLNKNLITLGFKMGEFEGHGMIYYVPSEDKVVQVGMDNRGGTAKGTWDAEGDKAVARLEYTPAEGEIRRMASVHSKVDDNTMKVEFYSMDSDGWLAEEPRRTLQYKRQKEQTLKNQRSDDPVANTLKALEGFEEVVNQALDDFNVPGAAIAVVAGGKVVYAEGFGFRDLEAQKPMTPNTLFAIGSTTKAMTATVLGMLVDDGKLDWDKPLRNYLPTFRLSNPMISERITPRDLVTHRSGLPRHDLLWYNNNESTRAELVERFAHLELSADLRERYQYNNLMFMTAGYLAGQLSSKTWEEVMRERLFEPLGMMRTNFSVAQSQKDDDFAHPYRENDEHEIERIPFRPIDLIGPAGSVNSSVNEMSRWLLFNLKSGRVDEKQLINPATLADIQSPHMTTGSTPERPEISQATYGLGWSIDTYRGHRRIAHGGGIDGFVTSVMLFPDDDLGLVSFNNRQSGISPLINQHAADRILRLESIDWLGESKEKRKKGLEVEDEDKQRKEATKVPNTHPSHPLSTYAGDYQHPGYGVLKIALADDALELTYNGIVSPLEHWHYDVWNGAETDGDSTFENNKFLFRSDVDGNIAVVESTFEPRTAPIVFKKRPDARLFDPEYLRRLAGTYAAVDEMKLIVDLTGGVLTLTVPGAPTYTLEPDINGRFVLQEARIVSLEFVLEDYKEATKVLIHSPGSISQALRLE